MCMGGSSPPPATPTPAPAPAPPSLPAEQQRIGVRRKRENAKRFGTEDGPSTRRDSGSGLKVGSGGNGIAM